MNAEETQEKPPEAPKPNLSQEAKSQPSIEYQLELSRWLIGRTDGLRGALTSRASTLLTANSILIAASALLIDPVLSNSQALRIPILSLIIVTIGLLAWSLYFTLQTMVSLKSSSDLLRVDRIDDRLFFNAAATIKTFAEDYPKFADTFRSSTNDDMLSHALSEFWTAQRLYRLRYQNFRMAMKRLYWALIPFVLSLVLFLIGVFIA